MKSASLAQLIAEMERVEYCSEFRVCYAGDDASKNDVEPPTRSSYSRPPYPGEMDICHCLGKCEGAYVMKPVDDERLEYSHLMMVIVKESPVERIPEQLAKLPELVGLSMRQGSLGSIEGIEKMKKLRFVDFTGNRLSEILPCNSLDLYWLALGCNYLRSIDPGMLPKSLKHIDIAYNSIAELPDFNGFGLLKCVHLQGNPISWEEASNRKSIEALESRGVKVYR
jgi:hypothetical protein